MPSTRPSRRHELLRSAGGFFLPSTWTTLQWSAAARQECPGCGRPRTSGAAATPVIFRRFRSIVRILSTIVDARRNGRGDDLARLELHRGPERGLEQLFWRWDRRWGERERPEPSAAEPRLELFAAASQPAADRANGASKASSGFLVGEPFEVAKNDGCPVALRQPGNLLVEKRP